jgi:hypothetical protein
VADLVADPVADPGEGPMEALMRSRIAGIVPVLLLALLLLRPVPARADPVDLALVLAVDVSRSIDNGEFELQRKGYAAALTNPRVLQAIAAGPYQAIAVCFVEWAGAEEQKVVIDWRVIRDEETAADFAAALIALPRSFIGRTSISAGVDAAMQALARNANATQRRLIDVSGDGTNNSGRPVTDARDEAVGAGVTINGLAIINEHPSYGFTAHTQPPEGLPAYYRRNVIGGPGAFLLVIQDFASFADAMTEKLVNEIAGTAPKRLRLGTSLGR